MRRPSASGGFDFMDDIDGWYAVMGPARLPRDIVAKLNADSARSCSRRRARAADEQGLVPVASTPEELAALIKAISRAGEGRRRSENQRGTDSDMTFAAATPLALLLLALAPALHAQSYPAKPVHVIVPYPAGGVVDALVRSSASLLPNRWRKP